MGAGETVRELYGAELEDREHATQCARGARGAMFKETSQAVLDVVLAPARLALELSCRLEAMLLHEAVDPNVSRRSLMARVENGATW